VSIAHAGKISGTCASASRNFYFLQVEIFNFFTVEIL